MLTLLADLTYCCDDLFEFDRPGTRGQPVVCYAIWPVREDLGQRVYERAWDGWHRDGRLPGMVAGG